MNQKIVMNKLSQRELEVLSHLSYGLSIEQVAQNMFLSKETIRSHKKNIYRKLDINNGIQLGMWIARNISFGNLKIA